MPGLRVERLDAGLQPLPGNQPVHLLEKDLAPRPARLQVVLQLRKRRLLQGSHSTPSPINQLCQNRLVQTIPRPSTTKSASTRQKTGRAGNFARSSVPKISVLRPYLQHRAIPILQKHEMRDTQSWLTFSLVLFRDYILEYAAVCPQINVRGDRTWHRKHPERAIARGSA